MKTKRHLLAALTAMCAMTLFTACYNDDNPASPTAPEVITINTADLYEELGIADLMANQLAEGEFILTDTVLIYDHLGNLVSKLGTESTTLEPLTIKTSGLPDGTYTLVAWQTARSKIGTRAWFTFDETKLSTVGITTPYGFMVYSWTVGYTSCTVTAKRGRIGATVTPKSMVSIVDVQVDNYPKDADIPRINFYCYAEGQHTGFYLDPSRSDADRWQEAGDWENLAFVTAGDSGDKFISLTNDVSKPVVLAAKYADGSTKDLGFSDDYELHIGNRTLIYLDYAHLWRVFFGNPEDFDTWMATPFGDRLKQIEGISEVTELNPYYANGFKELYTANFQQLVDHENPAAGTFQQKVMFYYKGSDRPTVFYTEANNLPDATKETPYISLAYEMNANLITVEHRYFGESQVAGNTNWDYLTNKQAAADYHAIVQALKPLLPQKWLSTGNALSGVKAIAFRNFYPDDVELTVAFNSPILTSFNDISVGRYMQDECGSQEERAQMVALTRRMLEGGEQGIYTKFVKQMQQVRPDDDRSFTQYVYYCFEYFLNVFTSNPPSLRKLPALDSTDDELVELMLANYIKGDYTEKNYEPGYYPYFVEVVKEVGRYENAYDDYADLLAGTSFDKEKALNYLHPLKPEDQWLIGTYDNTAAKDLRDRFVPTTTCPLLLIYSKDNPWTGARFDKVNEQYSKIIINPKGAFSDDINHTEEFAPETKKEILDFVSRYIPY